MSTTVTGLGGRSGERRQPRPGANWPMKEKNLSVEAGGVHLPAPSAEKPPPQAAKLSALTPQPCEQL